MVISLFCAGGMSTSVLVKKMEQATKEKGKDVEISAHSVTHLEKYLDGVDVALLGPQVGFQFDRVKAVCDERNIPVGIIPSADYGMCNGMNVLKFAYKLAGEKKE